MKRMKRLIVPAALLVACAAAPCVPAAFAGDAPTPRRGGKPTPPAGMGEDPGLPAPPADPAPKPAPTPPAPPAAPAPAAPGDAKAVDWTPFMGKLPFVVGFELGLDAAWEAGRPAMLFFVKAKSHWSQNFGRRTFSNADVIDALVVYQPILVDIEAEPEVAKRYGVTDIPAVVTIDREAKLLLIKQDDVPLEEFQEFADQARTKAPAIAPPTGELELLKRVREDLKKATETGDVKRMLDAAAALSSLHRPSTAAAEGKRLADELDKKGQARLAAAMMARADGKTAEAKAELEKLSKEYRGRSIGKVAAEQLHEMEAEAAAK
jgi:hypothetical protein